MYSITLTKDEYIALRDWLSPRGYDANMYETMSWEAKESNYVGTCQEHEAWSIKEAYEEDPHALGAIATPALTSKMVHFINAIV